MAGRTKEVFDFIRSYREKNGMAPTFREIGRAVQISTTSVVGYHLDQLEIAGLIKRHRGVARGIVVL